jgi:hypothetical protein
MVLERYSSLSCLRLNVNHAANIPIKIKARHTEWTGKFRHGQHFTSASFSPTTKGFACSLGKSDVGDEVFSIKRSSSIDFTGHFAFTIVSASGFRGSPK